MRILKQSSTAQPLVFKMVSSSDHVTPVTGATVTATISKNGGAFAAAAGAVSEISAGWYKIAGNATDTNTLGPLVLHCTAASSDNSDTVFDVVAYDPQDAVHFGLSALPNAAAAASGGLLTAGTSNYQLNAIAGIVDANMRQIDGEATNGYNATLNLAALQIYNSSGNAVSFTGANGPALAIASTNQPAITINATGGRGISVTSNSSNAIILGSGGNAAAIELAGAGNGAGLQIIGGTNGDAITLTPQGTGLGINGNLAGSVGSVANPVVLTSAYDSAKTCAPASTALSNAIWTNTMATYLSGPIPTLSQIQAGLPSLTAIINGLWNETLSNHVASGSMGETMRFMRASIAGLQSVTANSLTLYDVDKVTLVATLQLTPSGGPFTQRSP